MAYSTSNPPALMTGPLTTLQFPSGNTVGKQPSLWSLTGTDATTAVDASGYITNARDLGMSKGDVVWYIKTDAAPITAQLMIVSAINANGSGDLSDGTAITATNSD